MPISNMRSFTRNLNKISQNRGIHGVSYSPQKLQGISFAGRETASPTGSLSVVIRAGSRFQPDAGVAHLLEKFAFKNTEDRSALRITRESEILGGQLSTQLTREHIILTARFLNEYLEYYARLLAEVVDASQYLGFQLKEEVLPTAKLESSLWRSNLLNVAMAKLHEKAFHRGLGDLPYLPVGANASISQITDYAKAAYVKSNFTVVSSGPDVQKAADSVAKYFSVIRDGNPLPASPSKVASGESRIYSSKPVNHFLLGFPTNSAPSAELYVLSSILGGHSSIKWSHGNTLLAKASEKASEFKATAAANLHPYSDASLLSIVVSGTCTKAIRATASESVQAIKSLTSSIPAETIKAAVADAKTKYLTSYEPSVLNPVSTTSLFATNYQPESFISALDAVTPESVARTASTLLSRPASTVAVGKLNHLPYYDEL
ncbi:ubiquinol-cytochrome-c reductase complex core protein Qcr2 [Schizosaccharomyces cryophilus OY26]|uniref:Cytochrome b-c1 complex subunit 2, mitochondrial n=1 Tax=Schizosaccharomyces cryophilus (strain OY26 / ATCC MYA-4695 / CBS 11777 / NBRC 106824 / NRRL Y48691) TaxID=653667 RepID=S9VUY5_SCHCR|nr:ubiquinol-cytochrome-c reductase complex core protein Qcr2 [Schizosaccharomyces cryophilus OY26]EPY51603.1 ubiquinol-cytochrome-c reductase complex core protein Qcr2 [Schizosaccharomyces cryophilus OY26]